ncbi:protein phosphatase [Leucobacter komagatae]|uniref:Protein phosphatase n=1 Tax=Leucobacter komagatae TaxID=55969 RepID=A0A542Y7C7_9MICO|nr:protein phosphatase 2C domain-containing protein [Leucobacter komagatae]TQL44003.1 protein phosphatase [Leucobacter komagatae]
MNSLELDFAALTDVGRKRQVNEDSVLASTPCFLIADGMGGHEAGDLASQAALAAFAAGIPEGAPANVALAGETLNAARVAVAEVAAGRERGAGCTLTGAILVLHEDELHWLVLNIGDSRVYLHRGSELRQVTVDHSLVEEVRRTDAGAQLPPRNIITRALGSADSTADSWLIPVETGTRMLICSDGLTTELPDEELRAVLTMGGRADAVAAELVHRANDAGGRDNISVIVLDTLACDRTWHVNSTISGGAGDTAGDETVTATRPVPRPATGAAA